MTGGGGLAIVKLTGSGFAIVEVTGGGGLGRSACDSWGGNCCIWRWQRPRQHPLCHVSSLCFNQHTLLFVNIFALRSTDPRALERHRDPVGPGNDRAILRAARRADRVVAAWGVWGALGASSKQ